jgi:hypothetical protein
MLLTSGGLLCYTYGFTRDRNFLVTDWRWLSWAEVDTCRMRREDYVCRIPRYFANILQWRMRKTAKMYHNYSYFGRASNHVSSEYKAKTTQWHSVPELCPDDSCGGIRTYFARICFWDICIWISSFAMQMHWYVASLLGLLQGFILVKFYSVIHAFRFKRCHIVSASIR